ncbi:MAG: TetR/AcrR family transcriptional regulator, partial [Dermatophilaceae bacterium]
MSTSSSAAGRTSSGYHHGDLRNALLAQARELLASSGLDAVSLRELARRAGVSHAAPSRHFADRGEVLEALAVEGYRELARRMRVVQTDTGDVMDGVQALGMTYVAFAVEQPAVFRLMSRPDLAGSASRGPSLA